jgi:hypothetical protein
VSYRRRVRRLTGAGGSEPYILAMTIITCPSLRCPMCQRERCVACGQPDDRPKPDCAHDRLERHEGLPPSQGRSSTVRISRERALTEDEVRDRTPTKAMLAVLGGTIDVDLADTEAAAEFLEMVARVIREKKRLRISIE